jgi:hypothetical protein
MEKKVTGILLILGGAFILYKESKEPKPSKEEISATKGEALITPCKILGTAAILGGLYLSIKKYKDGK